MYTRKLWYLLCYLLGHHTHCPYICTSSLHPQVAHSVTVYKIVTTDRAGYAEFLLFNLRKSVGERFADYVLKEGHAQDKEKSHLISAAPKTFGESLWRYGPAREALGSSS